MLTVAYVGEGGVKNCQNYAYVIYGCPQSSGFKVTSQKSTVSQDTVLTLALKSNAKDVL